MSTQKLHIQLTIAGFPVEAAVAVPAQPAPRHLLLPILQNLTDIVVQVAEHQAGIEGFNVSCKKGCDACCRQMVPISPAEAYHLAAVVESLAPEHQRRVMKRFDRAERLLAQSGLLARLGQRHTMTEGEQHQLDIDYFQAQIPCPFLERHACSIHSRRPLACREFLVTSPAIHCRHPTAERVRQLRLPAKVSTALVTQDTAGWLPLILTRQFLAEQPEPTDGDLPHVLRAILAAL